MKDKYVCVCVWCVCVRAVLRATNLYVVGLVTQHSMVVWR